MKNTLLKFALTTVLALFALSASANTQPLTEQEQKVVDAYMSLTEYEMKYNNISPLMIKEKIDDVLISLEPTAGSRLYALCNLLKGKRLMYENNYEEASDVMLLLDSKDFVMTGWRTVLAWMLDSSECLFQMGCLDESVKLLEMTLKDFDNPEILLQDKVFVYVKLAKLLIEKGESLKAMHMAKECINLIILSFTGNIRKDFQPIKDAKINDKTIENSLVVGAIDDNIYKCSLLIKVLAENVVPVLSTKERLMFLDDVKLWFEFIVPNYALLTKSDITKYEALNQILLFKNLVLNSYRGMGDVVDLINDEELTADYKEYLDNKKKIIEVESEFYIKSQSWKNREKRFVKKFNDPTLNEQHQIYLEKMKMMLDLAEREFKKTLVNLSSYNSQLERKILRRIKPFSSRLFPKIAVPIVGASLGVEDVAVEFHRFKGVNDSVYYAAFVVERGDKSPVMVILDGEKIDALCRSAGRRLNEAELSEAVWKPLEKYFAGKKRIYFAPSGNLINMPIEFLPAGAEGKELMNDRYEMYRLSSTRELAVKRREMKKDDVVVFGGLDYDMPIEELVADSRGAGPTRRNEEDYIASQMFAYSDEAKRGAGCGLEPLAGAAVEAENVFRMFAGADRPVELAASRQGTEHAFKALGGRDLSVLHIATHGFYLTAEDAANQRCRFLGMRVLDDDGGMDMALYRSGLFMAGAGNIIGGEKIPRDVDDGVLTAQEISAVDLRGVDLVVLSACQSGLGDLFGDDVYGLQRGFKMAGVRSLMMSLWKVDDRATSVFMTEFYRGLVGGESKRRSFDRARRSLREYESANGSRPYDDIRYYGAFVLLDGLD